MDAGTQQICADDGFFFGIGAFETIAVEGGRPILMEAHLDRLRNAARVLGLGLDEERIAAEVAKALDALDSQGGRQVLKIAVSQMNLVVSTRRNLYGRGAYEKGFACMTSPVLRNDTSPLVRLKTFNYGDCLIEKRRSAQAGFDEPLFFNTRGLLAEGATTNVFLSMGGGLVTPRVECGLLPGIMRAWVMAHASVEERDVTVEDTAAADEMFLTNSLLGIMPVAALDGRALPSRERAGKLFAAYCAFAGIDLS